MAIPASLAGRMIASDHSVYRFNLWRKMVNIIKYIFIGRSFQADCEVLFHLLNINWSCMLDRIPETDVKVFLHIFGFIRMIDNGLPELKSNYGIEGRFRKGGKRKSKCD